MSIAQDNTLSQKSSFEFRSTTHDLVPTTHDTRPEAQTTHGFRTFNRAENRKEISVRDNLMLMAPNNSVVAIHITTQLIYDGNSRDFRVFSETRNISYIVLDGKLLKASGHFYYVH